MLDTNALSAAADDDAGVTEILKSVQQILLSAVVIGEFRYGVAQSRIGAHYRQWLDGLLADCGVLDITEQTTHHYATVRLELRQAGKPIPTNDTWIAALCREHGLPLLSRDRHFDVVAGLRRIDW